MPDSLRNVYASILDFCEKNLE